MKCIIVFAFMSQIIPGIVEHDATLVKCTLVQKSAKMPEIEPDYRHLKIDCKDSMKNLHMISDYELKYMPRWVGSDRCYVNR